MQAWPKLQPPTLCPWKRLILRPPAHLWPLGPSLWVPVSCCFSQGLFLLLCPHQHHHLLSPLQQKDGLLPPVSGKRKDQRPLSCLSPQHHATYFTQNTFLSFHNCSIGGTSFTASILKMTRLRLERVSNLLLVTVTKWYLEGLSTGSKTHSVSLSTTSLLPYIRKPGRGKK